jgi:acetolactate synthase regulatory subunit
MRPHVHQNTCTASSCMFTCNLQVKGQGRCCPCALDGDLDALYRLGAVSHLASDQPARAAAASAASHLSGLAAHQGSSARRMHIYTECITRLGFATVQLDSSQTLTDKHTTIAFASNSLAASHTLHSQLTKLSACTLHVCTLHVARAPSHSKQNHSEQQRGKSLGLVRLCSTLRVIFVHVEVSSRFSPIIHAARKYAYLCKACIRQLIRRHERTALNPWLRLA